MKLAWVGLVFHAVMILWLERNGLPVNHKSELCTAIRTPTRLLVAIMPGLRPEHLSIFQEYRTGVVGNIKQTGHKCPPVISYFSGVDTKPLFHNYLDTIFDHVSVTVYSGREDFPFDKDFFNVYKPVYYSNRERRNNERAELDGFIEFLWPKNNSYGEKKLVPANSTLFLLNLAGLKYSKTSMGAVRRLYFDVAQLVKSIDYLYGKVGTNVLILGDNGGPFALWGPDVSSSRSFLSVGPPDIAPLIAGLLGTAVPHDSVGLLTASVFKPISQKKAEAVTCNAEQLDRLARQTIRGPFMADLRRMYNNSFLGVNWLTKVTGHELWDAQASEYGSRLLWYLRCIYVEASLRLDKIALGLIMVGIVTWIFFLVVELTSITYAHVRDFWWPFIVMHVMFGILTVVSSVLPLICEWPYTYYVFTALPMLLTWAACCRIDVLVSLFVATPWKKIPIYVLYFIPVVLLAEYSLRASNFDMTSLIIGLCVLAQFPALPRFTVSPFIAKAGWCWCCFLLLGALHLPQWPFCHPRLYNLCGTIMICLSGFSSCWLKPSRDRILSVVLTLLTSMAMLIQPLSRSPHYQAQLKYITFPMMLVPFLSLIGKSRVENRLIHLTFSFGVLIMLTSSRMEPLCYLLALATCFLWMLMENFRLPKMLGANEVRRAIFLAVISHTTIAVTRTLPDAYLHLGYPLMTIFFELYRQTMILSSILAFYHTMLPSESHAYSSYVIVLMGDALATLRATAWDIDSTQLHIHGVAFALAYYLGSLLSTSDMTPDSEVEPDLLKDTIEA